MNKLAVLFMLGMSGAAVAAPVSGRYVRVDIPKDRATLSLAEVQVFSGGENVALKGTADQGYTAHNAIAQRAIDGNTSGIWQKNSITHTPEDQPNPMWEVDLGGVKTIDTIKVWNRSEIPARLNGVRVTILDGERKVVWDDSRAQPGVNDTTFVVDSTNAGSRVGQKVLTIAEEKLRVQLEERLKAININSLKDALAAYSAKYPESYPNVKELMARIENFASSAQVVAQKGESLTPLMAEYRALQKAVILQHPAVDFSEILFIKRPTSSKQGLFMNYQGNTAWKGANDGKLRGYQNEILRAPLCQENGPATVVRKSTAYMGELCLSYDAKKMLMSSGDEDRRSGPWGIYEMNIDGSDFEAVVKDDRDDVDYYDACYLPDGRILTTGTTGFQGVPCVSGGDFVANMHLVSKDRKTIRRLTFDQDLNWNPEVYPNGRVVFLRWEYADSAHYFSRVLMTMNPDGSDQQEFYGSNSYWPNSLFYHQNIPGSSTKFVGIVSGHHGVARKGELVMFDVAKGRIETSGAVHKFPFRGKPIENITKDQLVDNIKPYFLHPRPLNDELILVSIASDGRSPFRIAIVDVYDNILTLWESPNDSFYEPIPLKATPKPAIIPDRVNLSKKTCNVLMQNVYRGQKTLDGVPFGTVKKLRVYHYEYSPRNIGGHYNIGMEGPWDPRVLHGTVDVEEDGSCMFEFPANTPLSVQPIDENGHALQFMRSWLVGMPGETITCIGCHENQSAVAPTTPVIAARKAPKQITPWFGPARGFAFNREVQPVLDAKCVGCHNGDQSKKNAIGQPLPNFVFRGSRYGFSGSYLDLHPYVRRNGPEGDYHVLSPLEFHVTTSDLFQMLKKGHHGVELTDEEYDRLTTWIDLNVPFYGTWTEAGADKKMIASRRTYEKLNTNLTFDPEKIYDPYDPNNKAPFVMPKKHAPKQAAPEVVGWPFDGAVKQGEKQYLTLDIGGGQSIKAVKIPAGTFVMGSNNETPAEGPMCAVTIDKPFYMGTTEITMAQYRKFDPTYEDQVYDQHYKDQVRRGYFMRDPKMPVIRISWERANEFCKWLSEKTGKKVRLPTEAEWEYACRAGTATPMNYGDFNTDFSKYENLADVQMKKLAVRGIDPQPIHNPDPFMDYEKKDPRFNDGYLHLAPVGSYKPNAFGLYDMHGNVSEWTSSAYAPYPYNPNAQGEFKTVRGGSWYQRQIRASSAWRWGYEPWQRVYNVGIRVVVEE